jgi:hypothetical protein
MLSTLGGSGSVVIGALALLAALLVLGATQAAAQDHCAEPDPRDFGAVYACMQTIGPSLTLARRSCQGLRERYKGLLRNAGLTANRAIQYLPTCEMLVRVVSDLAGQVPSWAQCTGYPRAFDPEHFRRCLGPVAAGSSCTVLIDSYRQALMDADPYGQLPGGYSDPDCLSVARALAGPRKTGQAAPERPSPVAAQWARCLDYDPANLAAHMKRCLGPDLTALTTCRAVQQAYERSLTAAYNGLPQGYVIVPCPEAQTIVRLAQAQIEEKRLAAAEKRLAEERARREREAKAAQMEAQLRDLARQEPAGAAGSWWPNLWLVSLCALALIAASMFEMRWRQRLRKQEFDFDGDSESLEGILSRSRYAVYLLAFGLALYWYPVELVFGLLIASLPIGIWRAGLGARGYFK